MRVEAQEPNDADMEVICYTVLDCSSLSGSTTESIRDCCTRNTAALAYRAFGSEICVPCQGKHKLIKWLAKM